MLGSGGLYLCLGGRQLCAYSVFYGKAVVNLHWVVWSNQLCVCSGGLHLCAYSMLYGQVVICLQDGGSAE